VSTGKIVQGFELAPADVAERTDVCIVGSGCGGASLAMRLAEAGVDVVILEKGGFHTKDDFDQRELHALARIDGGRGLETSTDGGVGLTYGNNVGGASVHYWADSYRTPPDRLELWASKYGIEGHSEQLLAPHFEVIEKDLNVHLPDADKINPMNRLLKEGAEKLGWSVRAVPQARKDCRASGYCMQGCAWDAKQSQLVTYVPRAVAAGARVYADTRAAALTFDGTRVTRLDSEVLDRATGRPTGRRVAVEAKVFVVAAGGYETPAFLLAQGLGSRLPALGRHFFANPCPMVHALFDEDIQQWRNIPAAWGVEEFRLAREAGGKYLEGGYLLMANQLQPALLAAVLPGFGASHRALMRRMMNLGGTIAWIDDADEGRVSLEGGHRKVWVPVDGANGLRIRDAVSKQARVLFEAGATEVIFGDIADTRLKEASDVEAAVARLQLGAGRTLFAAPHPGGGARMGKDPASSVVGMDHRVHGTDNLYVSDPSVFPTAPSVDPSLTIMAFSFVAADAIRARL
jgi:choline dehydrogenase-like flavoprotein